MSAKELFELLLEKDEVRLLPCVTIEFNERGFHLVYNEDELVLATVHIIEIIRYLEDKRLIKEDE